MKRKYVLSRINTIGCLIVLCSLWLLFYNTWFSVFKIMNNLNYLILLYLFDTFYVINSNSNSIDLFRKKIYIEYQNILTAYTWSRLICLLAIRISSKDAAIRPFSCIIKYNSQYSSLKCISIEFPGSTCGKFIFLLSLW